MKKFICIHGHFYQPPRENPWLEEVETQDSAYPYHDWNKRITAECYAPNAASHILTSDGKLADIVNIYTKISFDFGPTLLSWLERHESRLYQAILDADKKSMEVFSLRHGSAMAQPYNHMIMPLANTRDKRTQIIWGIRDFEYRFKRKPEGMWLPETAVDLETLDIMAEYGIKFTILAPHQAMRERKIGTKNWKDIKKGTFYTNMPYLLNLPSKRNIAIFFYNDEISHNVAFGDLLNDGVRFANRLIGAFTESESDEDEQLVNIATDGETYGHHFRFGDMALAYCLNHIEKNDLAEITNFAEYLERFPPTHEVEILENTSWSCSHGIERWRSDCGCSSGINPAWRQSWRKPFRDGMDWLRDKLVDIYEKHMAPFSSDAWKTRNEYISVALDRSTKNLNSFLSRHIAKGLTKDEHIKILKLLEMQRNAMFMYTSCEWYFDDIFGIEAIQGLFYAARAIELANELSGVSLEDRYLAFLEKALCNASEFKNGKELYRTIIKPKVIDLLRIGAHYGISTLFEDHAKLTRINAYTAEKESCDSMELGQAKLALGTVSVYSSITLEKARISYAVLHFGGRDLIGGAKEDMGEESFSTMQKEVKQSFEKGEIEKTASLINKHFGGQNVTLNSLLKDKKMQILSKIFYSLSKGIEKTLHDIYKSQCSVVETSKLFRMPLLKLFRDNLRFAINMDIFTLLEKTGKIDYKKLEELMEEGEKFSVEFDKFTLAFVISNKLNSMMEEWFGKTEDISLIEGAIELLGVFEGLELDLNIRQSHNVYFYAQKRDLRSMLERAERGEKGAKIWTELFRDLGECLNVKVA